MADGSEGQSEVWVSGGIQGVACSKKSSWAQAVGADRAEGLPSPFMSE